MINISFTENVQKVIELAMNVTTDSEARVRCVCERNSDKGRFVFEQVSHCEKHREKVELVRQFAILERQSKSVDFVESRLARVNKGRAVVAVINGHC